MDITANRIPPNSIDQSLIGQGVMADTLYFLPYFILIADVNGKVIFANKVASDTFNYNPALDPQKTVAELISPRDGTTQLDQMQTAINPNGHWNGEIISTRPDDTQVLLELTSVRLESAVANGPVYLISGQEITRQKYRQREISQSEKYSMRGEMAGEISHELNNYLSIIMGNLELLGMGIAKGNIDALAPRIKSMRDGLGRVAKFVEGLMSLARPDNNYETIDLRQFVENELFYLKHNPKFNGIEFCYEWENDVPPIDTVYCRLQQALLNIFNNACDALADVPAGQKRITIRTSYSESDDQVHLSVVDNGCGMSEENYSKLFRQIFTTKGPGHGFGLLTTKGSIKSQGGRVSASPAPGSGVCITIDLPRQTSASRARTPKVSA